MISICQCQHAVRNLLRMLAALAFAVVLVGSLPTMVAAETPLVKTSRPDLRTVIVPIEGMICIACAATVKRAIKSLDGVQQVEVNLEKRIATVTYARNLLSADRIAAAVNRAGYKAGIPRDIK